MRTPPLAPGVLLALLAAPTARASVTMTGSYWEVNYGSCGTWWNGSEGIRLDDPYASSSSFGDNDFVGSAAPWTQVSIEFTYGGTAYEYDNNDGAGTCDWNVDYEYADSAVGYHFFSAGPLDIIRYESLRLTWSENYDGAPRNRGNDLIVWYEVWNPTGADVTDFQLMVAVNPDPDAGWSGAVATTNDVQNYDTSDSYNDWAGAYGATELTFGLSPCDPDEATIGFASNETDPDGPLSDPGGNTADQSMHYLFEGTISARQAQSFGFIFGTGTDYALTRDYVVDGAAGRMSFDYCDCDEDGDEFTGPQCGGSDCDDRDASVNPGATEVWYDGVDQDCADDDDDDADGDGFASSSSGGGDCDDSEAGISPAATEIWYDGVDQDCDGANDYDADGDGFESDAYGGTDCDDLNDEINPAETDTWYDGVDTDCSGSDYDADGDGHDHEDYGGDDCDDTDDDVYGGAPDSWYDGVDSDCGGNSDYDADGDGYDHDAFGGDDCDDTDADVNPGQAELWYDGVDNDCDDSTSDDDQDGDGHSRDEDCDDTDGSVWDGCDEPDDDDEGDEEDDTGPVVVEEHGGGRGAPEDVTGDKLTGGHGECACATQSAPAAMGWLGLLGLVGLARRRREG